MNETIIELQNRLSQEASVGLPPKEEALVPPFDSSDMSEIDQYDYSSDNNKEYYVIRVLMVEKL